MIQTWGMRRPGGRVRHIVQTDREQPKYAGMFSLCGLFVETMNLADTVGETCQNCLKHPKFNAKEVNSER